MSSELNLMKYNIGKDTYKSACIELYGLHYDTNWIELIVRGLAIKALEINEEIDYYTEDEVRCLKARIGVMGKSSHRTLFNNRISKKGCCN